MTMWLLVINKKINKLIFKKKKIIYLNKNNKQTKKMFSNHIRKDSEEKQKEITFRFSKSNKQTNNKEHTASLE